MPQAPAFPSLYQVNTRVWLTERARRLGRPATLDDIPDPFLDEVAARGFDWFWPLGVWQTGPAAREISRTREEWRREYCATLPDFVDADVSGSPFAIQKYVVHSDFGGPEALARLRRRLSSRGVRLLLDFVPNHTAPDHPWAVEHPEYYVAGSEEDLAREPHNYLRVATSQGPKILAHGRDPYFPGWADTLQLNYRSDALRAAMRGELASIAAQCDGVRCDMAMLVLPYVIHRTWGDRARPSDGTPPVDASFWPEAISHVRHRRPDFLFMAEVYWDMEYTLQQQGFDYTYDKRLYDRLHGQDAQAVRGHLNADADFQRKSVRFLENHDEPRAAAAFPPAVHQAAAVVAFFVPGLRFVHEGEFEGRKVCVSMHLGRRPDEPVDATLFAFYQRLLEAARRPEVRDGAWKLLNCRPSWEGNPTHRSFLTFSWDGADGKRLLVCVNYGPSYGQCFVELPWSDLRGAQWRLADQLSPAVYDRDGNDLANRGLYVDMPPWGHHVFDVSRCT